MAFIVACALGGFIVGALVAGELGLVSINPGPRLLGFFGNPSIGDAVAHGATVAR